MGGFDIKEAISIIESHKNPEIHHYNRGFHPGIKWYIKTIIPIASHVDDSFRYVIDGWHGLSEKNPDLVRVSDVAFHWNGDRIPGWNTIWLDERHDVAWKIEKDQVLFEVIDHEEGIRQSANGLMDLFSGDASDEQCADRLEEIACALRTYSSTKSIIRKRSRIRMVFND